MTLELIPYTRTIQFRASLQSHRIPPCFRRDMLHGNDALKVSAYREHQFSREFA